MQAGEAEVWKRLDSLAEDYEKFRRAPERFHVLRIPGHTLFLDIRNRKIRSVITPKGFRRHDKVSKHNAMMATIIFWSMGL